MCSGSVTFENLFDLVDAPAWSIEFITGELIGRAGGIAETTVHTAA